MPNKIFFLNCYYMTYSYLVYIWKQWSYLLSFWNIPCLIILNLWCWSKEVLINGFHFHLHYFWGIITSHSILVPTHVTISYFCFLKFILNWVNLVIKSIVTVVLFNKYKIQTRFSPIFSCFWWKWQKILMWIQYSRSTNCDKKKAQITLKCYLVFFHIKNKLQIT
jgi:hypothetical protein